MTTPLLSNGGPPLDDDDSYVPPWGKNGIGRYFEWRDGKKRAFDAPYDIAKIRTQRAALIGLTYDEYVLEILERSPAIRAQLSWPSPLNLLHWSKFACGPARSLNASDTERIAQIVAKRGVRY